MDQLENHVNDVCVVLGGTRELFCCCFSCVCVCVCVCGTEREGGEMRMGTVPSVVAFMNTNEHNVAMQTLFSLRN